MFYKSETLLFVPITGLIIVIIMYVFNKSDKHGREKEFDRLIKQRVDRANSDKAEEEKEYTRDDKVPLLNIQKSDNFNKTGIVFDESNVSLVPEEGSYKIEAGNYDIEGKLVISPKTVPPKYEKDGYDPIFSVDEIVEYNNAVCRKPTPDNPYMNINITDWGAGDVPVAGNADDDEIKNDVKVNFNQGLFRDVDELWEKENSQRQFYTMPNTGVPNNLVDFAKWLYRVPETCKEDTVNCNRWEDLRYKNGDYQR